MRSPAKLVLEDGRVFTGESYGAVGETSGEICFNTSMTGYQEILTDPSYCGQIVAMTYPQIGNYGINQSDVESSQPYLSGFVIREPSRIPSSYRSEGDLEEYLQDHEVVGLCGVDTRALVRHIRTQGAMKAVLSSVDLDDASLIQKAESSPGLVGRDLVSEVMPSKTRVWDEGLHELAGAPPSDSDAAHVVALDYGMKWNIARHLFQRGCRVTVLPGNSTADKVMALEPDGVFLSNGPGDPEPLGFAIECIRQLHPKLPLFGICLGHQLFALANGAATFKMKFGHRGANQPVLNCITGKVEITAQNHGFAVDESGLPDHLEITHRHLNDDTIAGLRHRERPAFSVQYHPEASAGPHDSDYLFAQFVDQLRGQPA
jgi:carbamoyl-phosphate synthase small subunit